MSAKGWNYFDGGVHYWLGKPPAPRTACYCGKCAPKHLPGWNAAAKAGREHWDTGFRCGAAPVGDSCKACGVAT